MSVAFRIRAWPRAAATGAAIAVFLAGGNNGAPHHDGTNHYQAGVIADPRFEASVSFTDDGWAVQAVPSAAAIGWAPADPAKLDQFTVLYWRDAAIEVDRIKDGVVTRRLTGTIAAASVSDGKLVITCSDLTKILDKPVTAATFAGTGGIEGGDFAIGRTKRRSFGRVWNVEGRLLDKVNNIYEFGDPAFPLQGCTALRDMGRAGPLGIIAWQGSIAATLNALKAATPERGGGLFAPSIACAKWWTQPAGPLTADLLGEAAGYAETAAGIAAQLLGLAQGPTISNLAAANALRPAVCGLHIGDNSETTATALNRLLQSITLGWRVTPAGSVEIWNYTFTGPVETLNATFISRESTIQPVKSRQVGYKRNERVHGDGEISAAVQASDVVYEDGTTAEDYKPAEPGATKGASPEEKDQLDQLEQDTAAAAVAIAAAETTIASVEAQVNADLSQMQDAIDGFNTDIGSLTAEIGTVTADLDSLAAQVTAAGGQIDTIQTTLGEQGASISSLQTTVSNQAGTLATHTSQISTANANISANATAISTANGNIASLSSTVSTQGGYISTLQQSVTNLSGTVSTLSSTVATQGTSITNLQSASSTQAGQIATITTQLTAGNSNLLPNSTFENGLSNWDIESVAGQAHGTFSSSQGVYFYVSSGAGILPDGFYYISNQARIVCGEGEVFTATANTDLAGPAVSGSSGTYLEFLWFNGASLHSSVAGPYHAGTHSFSQSATNRPLSKWSAACPAGANRVSVRFVSRVVGGGVNHIGVQTVKLERGAVATPYSQEASVGQSFQAISTINGSLASLSSTVSTQGATISQNATAISTLQGQQASLSSTVSAQGSSISSLQTATSTLQGNVATLTTRVSASGANLLPNGGLENGFATGVDSSGGFNFQVSNDWGPIALAHGNGLRVFYFSPVMFPQPGRSYTFSVDPLAFGTSDIYCNIQCVDAGGTVILDGQANYIGLNFDFENTDVRRGQIACTVTVPSGTNRLVCRVYGTVRNGDPIGFRRAKLENGSQWSRYSAEATAVQQFQTLSTLNTQYASLSSTVSTQGVSISTQATAISTLNGNVAALFGQWGVELDVNGYVSGIKTNNNGTRADMTLRMDKVKMVTPSGLGGYWQVIFDGQGRPTQTVGDDASGVMIEIGYLA